MSLIVDRVETTSQPLAPPTDVREAVALDAEQLAIVNAPRTARTVVSAGPGMGKTEVACARIAKLIDEDDLRPSVIWLMSFTRTAVRELRNRIESHAQASSSGLKIATIDSQAWRLRTGFDGSGKVFGGYEAAISAARASIEKNAEEVRDVLSPLEHMIIDEAQDIVGERAALVATLMELLPLGCGVTIFHDPAQAIYDGEDGAEERLVDRLEAAGASLDRRDLTVVYRTKDPKLRALYGSFRADVLDHPATDVGTFAGKTAAVRAVADAVEGSNFDVGRFDAASEELILFRRRIQAAQAAAFLAKEGIPYRLRMSGLPQQLHPWIALSLRGAASDALEEAEFLDLHAAAATDHRSSMDLGENGDVAEERWEALLRTGRRSKARVVSLSVLRERLAHGVLDRFVAFEYGRTGPTLGTIHASKGREAADVVLNIDRHWETDDRHDASRFGEESRVLFVGASRARRSLQVQSVLSIPYSQQTTDGRAFRRSRKGGVQVEVGRTGDYDPFSAAPYDVAGICTDLPVPLNASFDFDEKRHVIRTDEGQPLGSFSEQFNYGLLDVARALGGRRPTSLRFFSAIGSATVVAADEGELERVEAHAPNGFWLVPQIYGLSYCWFGKSK